MYSLKKLGSRLLMLALLLVAASALAGEARATDTWDGTVASDFAGGDGSGANPWQIATGAQLAYLAQQVNGENGNHYSRTFFVLTDDIDLGDHPWTPIGRDDSHCYYATFDGRGHTISGLKVSDETRAGLFGSFGSGEIRNLNVSGTVSASGYRSAAGGVVGKNESVVTGCTYSGSVTASGSESAAGGVVGENSYTVMYCQHVGGGTVSTPSANSAAGGVVGKNNGAVISCSNDGTVSAPSAGSAAGGVAGVNTGTATNCYNTGAVTVNGESSFAGGVVGKNSGTAQNCYYTGETANAAGSGNGTSENVGKLGSGGFSLAALDTDVVWTTADPPALRGLTETVPREPKTWSQLYDALRLCGYIRLADDVTYGDAGKTPGPHSNSSLLGGGFTVLDLNGKTVDRGLGAADAEPVISGCVLWVGGDLTLKDSGTGGRLTGGNTTGNGGGVHVHCGAEYHIFTMTGGTISGNRAAQGGGGVFIESDPNYDSGAAFLMTGGTIDGNTAAQGGGVFTDDNDVTFAFSGNASVSGNTGGNVHLRAGRTVAVAGALSETASIGVTTATAPTAGSPVAITSGLSGKGTAANFTSDNAAYVPAVLANTTEASLLLIETQPAAAFTATGADSGELSGLDANANYSISGAGLSATDIAADADGKCAIASGLAAGTLSIVKKGLAAEANSSAQTIAVTKAAAPTAPSVTGCTTPADNDGKLTGVTTAMEYKKPDAASWTDGTGGDITDLAPGAYYVRVKAAGATLASDNQTLTIVAYVAPRQHSSSDGGRDSDGTSPYTPSVAAAEHGAVSVTPQNPKIGDTVTVSAKPDSGYQLARVTVTDAQGKSVPVEHTSGSVTFTQPAGRVKVEVIFATVPTPPVGGVRALASPQKLTVNGSEQRVEAYNIGDTNFFRLRDLAALLKGTEAQFGVSFDPARNAVVLISGVAYDGAAATLGADMSESAVVSPQTVELDGRSISLTAYNIGGNNFFGLRELAQFLGYGVNYDAASNTAQITSK